MLTTPGQQMPDTGGLQPENYPPNLFHLAPRPATRRLAGPGEATADAADDPDDGADDSLDEAARTEGEYLRGRLRAELGREPTEAELNEWLRQHTEGY